jgi:Amidohydrolase
MPNEMNAKSLKGANSDADRHRKREPIKKGSGKCPLEEGFPPFFIDAHMHIQSGGCAPLPPLRKAVADSAGFAGGLVDQALKRNPLGFGHRDSLNWAASKVKSDAAEVQVKPTDEVGKVLVQYNDGMKYVADPALASYLGSSIVLTMDMDYCHIDGYDGLPIYFEETEGDKKGDRYYLERDRGDTPRTDTKTVTKRYVDWHEDLPMDIVEAQAELLDLRADKKKSPQAKAEQEAKIRAERKESLGKHADREFREKNPRPMPAGEFDYTYPERAEAWENERKAHVVAKTNEREAALDEAINSGHLGGADKLDKFLMELSGNLYETWSQQLFRTERATLKHPLRLLPMYHYEPRRYVKGGGNAPYSQLVVNGGVYIGFKMYTSQGYMPKEDTAKGAAVGGVTKPFFAKCAAQKISIMAHCTPAGFYTHHRDLYYDLASAGTAKAYIPPGKKEARETDRRRYFQQKFVHPEAWRPVLQDNSQLYLCLAHFASDKVLWKDDPADLDKPTLTAAERYAVEAGMAQFNSDRKSWGRIWRGIKDPKDLLDAYWNEKSPYGGKARPSFDANGTMYEKGWIRSIVELCQQYPNFYTDISYLPLVSELERSDYDPAKHLTHYWMVLAEILKRKPYMKDKIMFGTDWYMILLEPVHYREWFDNTIKSLKKVQDYLGIKHDLFHQFAIVNPIRFYRLDELGGQLKANLEKKIASTLQGPEKTKAMKELKQNYRTWKRIKEGPGTLKEMIAEVKNGPLPFTLNPLVGQKEKP